MMNESKLDSADEEKHQKPPSEDGDAKKERAEDAVDQESSTEHRATNTRKAGVSKREIMEELSRQRFPWDE